MGSLRYSLIGKQSMTGNLFRMLSVAGRVCALGGVVAFVAGCGMTLAGPGETVSVATVAGEDLQGPCKFDINMPDQPLTTVGEQVSTPAPVEVAALVVYERGDSSTLFNDPAVQTMAASQHLVTVFAHQCNSVITGDIQGDATKGQGRVLFAALAQYSSDTKHAEIANIKVLLSGFSAAGVLSTTMANAYPGRVLGFVPFASGDAYLDLDTVPVTAAAAKIPALVLANAYDSQSGDMRSLRYFQRGWAQGAPWGFGVQNHTGHCCTDSTASLMIPWMTALTQPLQVLPVTAAGQSVATATPVNWAAIAAASGPTMNFWCYTDGWPDTYGENDCFVVTASLLPTTGGGPSAGWLPDAASADAWLKWVTSPGTN